MRKENYMIAFINKKLLDLKIPWWLAFFVGNNSLILTYSLELSINYCILEHMFNDNYTISNIFLKDKESLMWRFKFIGFLHIILLPFLLIFMIIHFFMENAQQYYSNKSYFGPRQWRYVFK